MGAATSHRPGPPPCAQCGATDKVKIERVITGHVVAVHWRCERCDYEWPITSPEPT